MTEGKRNIIYQLLEECDIKTADDIHESTQRLAWRNHQRDFRRIVNLHLSRRWLKSARKTFLTSTKRSSLYGFEASEGFISDVTDKTLPQIGDWQNRPQDEVYPMLYIDAIQLAQEEHQPYARTAKKVTGK